MQLPLCRGVAGDAMAGLIGLMPRMNRINESSGGLFEKISPKDAGDVELWFPFAIS